MSPTKASATQGMSETVLVESPDREVIPETTPRPPPEEIQKTPFEPVILKVEMTLRFNLTFEPDLHNPESKLYKETSKNYTNQLEEIYGTLPNFKRVVILNFWEGSVGVAYRAEFDAIDEDTSKPVTVAEVTNKFVEVKEKMLSLANIDATYVNDNFDVAMAPVLEELDDLNKDVCARKDICRDTIRQQCDAEEGGCVYKCSVKDVCPPNAECSLSEGGIVQCRCKHSGDRIYGGPNCTLVAERTIDEFSTEQIIAASVGSSSGVLLIAAVVIFVIVYRRRKRKARSNKALASSKSDVEMTKLGRDGPGDDKSIESSDSSSATSGLKQAGLLWRSSVAQPAASNFDWRAVLATTVLPHYSRENPLSPLQKVTPRNSYVDYGYYEDLMSSSASLRLDSSDADAVQRNGSTGDVRKSISVAAHPRGESQDYFYRGGNWYLEPQRRRVNDYSNGVEIQRDGYRRSLGSLEAAKIHAASRNTNSQVAERQARRVEGQLQRAEVRGHRSDFVRCHGGRDTIPDPDYPVWNELPTTERRVTLPRLLLNQP